MFDPDADAVVSPISRHINVFILSFILSYSIPREIVAHEKKREENIIRRKVGQKCADKYSVLLSLPPSNECKGSGERKRNEIALESLSCMYRCIIDRALPALSS